MSESHQLIPERYREILDTAPDAMIVLSSSGRIVYANRQNRGLFGIAPDELIGKELEVLLPPRFREVHALHLRRYFSAPSVRPMGSGVELFGLRADGEEVPIEVSLSPVGQGEGMLVCAAIRDISERKQIEKNAKLAAERLSSAVESIKEPFALFDAERRLVQCNSAYRRFVAENVSGPILGAPLAELSRAWMANHAPPSSRQTSVDDPAATFDLQLGQRNYRMSNQPTLEGGIVQTIWDLTDDVQREEELRIARSAAEAGSAAKSDFLSSMSHELRTPMNAVLGFAQLLQRDKKEPLSERQRDRAAQILKGGEHLLRLIDDILDLSRIEAGNIAISTEPVDARVVLEETKKTLEATALRDEITIHISPPPPDLPAVNVDRTRFAQILMNLGSNAIKYNRRGGKVTFTARPSVPDRVRITVSDTGLGVPLDKQHKLFQPFQRAGQETGPIEGTGIGLVITKRLAELMGGGVGFESVPDQGSEFWVEVPALVQTARVTTPLADARSERLLDESGVERLVLYVEDNPANVSFMRDLLSGLDNVALATAPTAEMGLELARAQPPDVVILDINLPGMSGLDALRALKEMPETRDLPVIALTAAASERDRIRGEQAGFYRYLTKPVNVDELEQALLSLFARQPAGVGKVVPESDSKE
jgi:PAS domain S-box-containing protein